MHESISCLGYFPSCNFCTKLQLYWDNLRWVTSEWCTFDNPDGYSTFVIRKPGTNVQNAKRAYVPNTGVE